MQRGEILLINTIKILNKYIIDNKYFIVLALHQGSNQYGSISFKVKSEITESFGVVTIILIVIGTLILLIWGGLILKMLLKPFKQEETYRSLSINNNDIRNEINASNEINSLGSSQRRDKGKYMQMNEDS